MSEIGIDALRRWREHPELMVRELFGVEPEGWQDDVLMALPHKQRIAMRASKGPGKAQPKSTIIDTPYGKREFGSLKAGDFVFAIDGMPTRVKAVYDRGVRATHRVTFDDGSSTVVCAEHLWRVRGSAERARVGYDKTDPESGWVVLSTEQIIARGVRNKNGKWEGRQFEIPTHGAAFYPKQDLPMDPYIMGAWLGDGCRNSGKIAAKKNNDVEDECRRRGATGTRVQDEMFYVIGLMDALKRYGLCDKYSYEKSIPVAYLQSDETQRLDLLRGLMDTDGFIDIDSTCEFATTSPCLAKDVVWLVRSLGGRAYICDGVKKPFYYNDAKKKIYGRLCYRVRVRLPVNPFIMSTKAVRWKSPYQSPEALRYMKRYIDRIEEVGEQDCCCIAVEHPTKCYLTNDFIVTHNTACEAWCAWNFLLTRLHPKIGAVSITASNLSLNLWTEMAKWLNKSPLLQSMFAWTHERIFHKKYPATWYMAALAWPKTASTEQQADTLAGMHADYILFIVDESGAIPPAVLVAADAALGSCVEGHIIQGGNTNSLSGMLYEATITQKSHWHVVTVTGDPEDPKRSARVSIEWAQQLIDRYGRDHPYVMVNVLGQFPPGSFNTLLSMEEIREAQARSYREADIVKQPRILGVDVALYGKDASVIFPRQGLVALAQERHRNIDPHIGAGRVAARIVDWQADATFIDNTGGYGASWISHLRLLGHNPIGVGFSQSPNDPQFFNKRAEIYFAGAQWVKDGGQLPGPNVPGMAEFAAAMTETTYTAKRDKLILEPKELIEDRIGYSPDDADSFCLSFSHPVSPKARHDGRSQHRSEWDYGEALARIETSNPSRRHSYEYDPFA